MWAMQLGRMQASSASVVQKGHTAPHPSTISESFSRAWQREIGTAKSGATKQLPMALDSMLRITARENKTQLSLARNVGARARKSEDEPTANRVERETAEDKDTPRDLPKVTEVNGQRIDADQPECAGLSLDGKFAKLRGKHDAAAAKSVGTVAEGRGSDAETQPGVSNAVATNAPECGAGVVPPASAPVGPTAEPAGPKPVSASRAVALEKAQAASSRAKLNAAPAVARGRPEMVEAKHECVQTRAAINVGAVASRANSEGSPSASNGVPLRAAEEATVAVPPLTSSHSTALPPRSGTRLDVTKAAEDPQVLESGPARLDVGVFDGTHGWLRIRAELSTGGAVNASLTAGATAHESLRAVLPEMASYLQSEAVSVSRIAVHRAAAGSNGMGTSEGQQNDGAPRQGAAGEQGQNGGGSLKRNVPATEQSEAGLVITATRAAGDARSAGGVHAIARLGVGFGVPGGSSGGWLNVCA